MLDSDLDPFFQSEFIEAQIHMKAYLGIDGGGSGSRWLLLDEDARKVARGTGPALQARDLGPVEVAARLSTILTEAREVSPDPQAVVIDLAGAGDPTVRRRLAGILRELVEDLPMHLISDPVAAAGVALRDGPAVAAWAGTGSFAIARDGRDTLHRLGGRGPLLGDQGCGYSLVCRAGRRAVAAAEGISPATLLGERLAAALELDAVFDLGGRMQAMTTGQVAALAPLVIGAAEEGDLVAAEVLGACAEDLVQVVLAAARRAELDRANLDVALGGGLFAAETYRQHFSKALLAAGLERPPRLAEEAVLGAALLARDLSLESEPFCYWLEDGTAT